MRRELLEIERLIPEHQRHTAPERRRVSVAEHQSFREDMQRRLRGMQPADEIDELVADPLIERIGRGRKQSEAKRVLDILDELERSDG